MPTPESRVVVVGANFAGLVAASRISACHAVTVIDPRAEIEWTPNIHELLSGVKQRSGLVLPRAECVERYGHTYVQDAVTSVDTRKNTVQTAAGDTLDYAACVIAAGSATTTFDVPGAEQHAIPLRLVDDGVRIAKALDKLAQRSGRKSVVVVGGGVSGVEVIGELLRRCAGHTGFDLHIVEMASRVLPQQPTALSADATKLLQQHGVTVHTASAVARVSARRVTLADGTTIAAHLCIWSAGMRLPDFLTGSKLCPAGQDWLPVDDTLRSTHADNVFVAGDCARLPEPIRKQAFHAMDMGAVAGDNVGRLLNGRSMRTFRAARTPMLIAFGDITTWLVAGERVLASPLLAAGKEGVYQATMARFASPQQPLAYCSGVATRAADAAHRLLLPQLRPRALLAGLTGARIIA